jgi:hypothetical protein
MFGRSVLHVTHRIDGPPTTITEAGRPFLRRWATSKMLTSPPLLHANPICRRPVIALVGGNTFGGGIGVLAACDMAFAVKAAKFTLSEVKLGVIPAGDWFLSSVSASCLCVCTTQNQTKQINK